MAIFDHEGDESGALGPESVASGDVYFFGCLFVGCCGLPYDGDVYGCKDYHNDEYDAYFVSDAEVCKEIGGCFFVFV